jgi:O-antigen/teichoic acid export membrane protein
MTASPREGPPSTSRQGGSSALVLRNAAWLVLARLAATPLSIAVQGVIGRHLGAADFGYLYLAGTLSAAGFLVVDFGQGTALAGLVASDRARAGDFLGATLAWRAASAVAVYVLLALTCHLLGLGTTLQQVIVLVALASALLALAQGGQDIVRGFERTDMAAYGVVGERLLAAALVVPALLLGARLVGLLTAQVAAGCLGLVAVALVLRHVGVPRLVVRRATIAELLKAGWPFFVLGVALAVQPNVDAVLLARMTPPRVVGWHAAALKLYGALMLPAASLITALYPTLCRLHALDPPAYRRTARTGLETAALLAVPLAIGCGLFPDLGVWIFGRSTFGPSEANLTVLSPCLLLTYHSMALGCCLSAAGRQRVWSIAQLACVAVGAVADWLLIPYCQSRWGNGGLGVCASLGLCEVLLLAAAIGLQAPGVLDRSVMRTVGLSLCGGVLMAVAALLLRGSNRLVSASASGLVYIAFLVATRAVDPEILTATREAVYRRMRRSIG